MITVKVKDSVSKSLGNSIRKFPEATDKALSVATIYGMKTIKDRTAKSVSVNGTAFMRYSEGYRKWKRRYAGKGGAKPNLFLHGSMLGSMTTGIKNGDGRIYFARKAESKKAMWNDKTRPFFDLNGGERKEIMDEFESEFLRLIDL